MTGKKSAYLCALLCALLSSLVISDVNARTVSSQGHGQSGSHSNSSPHHIGRGSVLENKYSQAHSYPASNFREVRSTHSYPSSSGHSLSGSTGRSSVQSYPASNKLSGSGNHPGSPSYPSTNFRVTGGSTVHTYPASRPNSISGDATSSSGHGYPSSNIQSGSGTQLGSIQNSATILGAVSGSAVHNYPPSRPNSLSGGASSFSGRGYPTSSIQPSFGTQLGPAQYTSATSGANNGLSVHSYPTSRPNSLSGSASGSGYRPASYPPSHGFSGNTASQQNTYRSSNNHYSTSWGSDTQINQVNTGGRPVVYHHHHYIYNPPTVIHYGSYGTHPISYPVYTGLPPPYVYEYRTSGNKYSHLLSGLALYNLGRISETSNSLQYHNNYNPRPDEYCKFGVKYSSGNFEEMAIDCRAITYFIYEDEPQAQTYATTNIVNQTIVTTQLMFANGSLVETGNVHSQHNVVDGPVVPNVQTQVLSPSGTLLPQQILTSNGHLVPNTQQINSVSTTTTQVTSVTDRRLAGRPVEVKTDMKCYVTRNTRYTNMKKTVPCELLQKYSASLRNSCANVKSSLTVILVVFAFALY